MIKVNNLIYFYRSINLPEDTIYTYDNKYRDCSRAVTIKYSTSLPRDLTFNVTHLYPGRVYSTKLWRF